MTTQGRELFRTERLRVDRFTDADVRTFTAYRADPDIARFQGWADYTEAEARRLVESMHDADPGTPGQWFQLAIRPTGSDELLGDLALRVDAQEPRQAEVGFTLATAHQGRGYATEALTGLLSHAFASYGLHRIIAVTDARNTAAASVLERVGMRCEAHFVDNVHFKGEWGSEYLFAVLDREWRREP